MNVLVACEFSGIVRDAFIALGHNAWSCDLEPTEKPGPHFRGDAIEVLHGYEWDLVIAHPPCTYLCSSGLHWNNRTPGRAEKTEEALVFVKQFMDADVERIAIENPVGCISTRIRPYDQVIQPYDFGDDASKKTCLWLKNLPILKPTCRVLGRTVGGKERWANQTDSGQNRLGPSDTRAADRSRTYPGIAAAMASQWGGVNKAAVRQTA